MEGVEVDIENDVDLVMLIMQSMSIVMLMVLMSSLSMMLGCY